MIKDISAVIMAGGKSSRMGTDKALLKLDRCDTMCEYQYKKLKKIFKNVYISSKTDKFDFLDKKYLILDKKETFSPMEALDAIFDKIEEEKIFILTVDMPLIKLDTVEKLLEISRNSNAKITLAKDLKNNRHSLCGVYSRSIGQKVKNCLARDIHKINYLINSCDFCEIVFDDFEQFMNLNTKEEYIKAENILKNR